VWAIRSRTGARAEATANLLAYWARRQAEGADTWPLTVIGFVAGKVPESALVDALAKAEPSLVPARTTTASYFAGIVALLDGDTRAATGNFSKAVSADAVTSLEYDSAVAALKTLQGGGR
jgi:hypothetical protein